MQLACLQFIMSLKIKSLMMTLELKQVDIKSECITSDCLQMG